MSLKRLFIIVEAKELPSDIRELKEMVTSLIARVKYVETLLLNVTDRINKKGI